MAKSKKRYLKKIASAGLAAVFAVLIFAAWIFGGRLTESKLDLLKSFPVPIAKVGQTTLTTKQLAQRMSLEKNVQGEAAGMTQAFSRLVEEAKIQAAADLRGIKMGASETDAEYQRVLSNTAKSELDNFPLSDTETKKILVKPALARVKLNIWYNSQENFNAKPHQFARLLKNRAANGEDFEQLAMLYSEDPASQAFGGEAGFLPLNSVLPELAQELENSKEGDVMLLPSRLGLHIIKIEARQKGGQSAEQSVKLKQIFIKTQGFEQWLAQETSGISVKPYIKI